MEAQLTKRRRFRCLGDLRRESLDLILLYCGVEDCASKHRFGPNMRDSHVLHIVLEGKGKLEINKETYELKQHDAFYIPQGERAFYEADYHQPWTYLWVGITGVMAKDTIAHAGFNQKVPARKVGAECIPGLLEYVEKMMESHQTTYADGLRRMSALTGFWALLIDDYGKGREKKDSYDYPDAVYVNQAADYMKNHYMEKILIQDIADYIGVNRSYLSRKFQQAAGLSPKQYLLEIRMKKAAALLAKGQEPVGSIARSVGYEDPLNFSRAFKLHFGVSPKDYRREK